MLAKVTGSKNIGHTDLQLICGHSQCQPKPSKYNANIMNSEGKLMQNHWNMKYIYKLKLNSKTTMYKHVTNFKLIILNLLILMSSSTGTQ